MQGWRYWRCRKFIALHPPNPWELLDVRFEQYSNVAHWRASGSSALLVASLSSLFAAIHISARREKIPSSILCSSDHEASETCGFLPSSALF